MIGLGDYMARVNSREKYLVEDDADRLMPLREVAARLATSVPSVRRIIEGNHLPVVRNGKRTYVRKVTLDGFLMELEGRDLADLITGDR